MRLKKGVSLFGVRPELIWAYQICNRIYEKHGNEENCVVTSVRDGKHKRSSDHYLGAAFDLRVWGFTDITLDYVPDTTVSGQEVANEIQEELTDEFEVFFEGDHIHIGFDPDTL